MKTREHSDLRSSYTAADALPIKVVLDEDVRRAVARNRIPPIHVQFIPTNKCNQNCKFCSCSDRDKNLEMPYEQACQIIDECRALGTKAVTITGGGEPCVYPEINSLISYFVSDGIKVGLVTNGLSLHRVMPDVLDLVTWCRVSVSDERPFEAHVTERLSTIVQKCPHVDWAFSYVVSPEWKLANIVGYVEFANRHNFTHVRLVPDLFIPQEVHMGTVKRMVGGMVDDSKVIYQMRDKYTEGGPCFICYLKPVIGPDARVYACCGVQYALETPSRDLPEELCLGEAKNLRQIIARSDEPLDGSICSKCYYSSYNSLLGAMLNKIDHKEFV